MGNNNTTGAAYQINMTARFGGISMHYETELRFFQKLLENFHISLFLFRKPFDSLPELDLGLHNLLCPSASYRESVSRISGYCKPNLIYRVADEFLCHYIFFRLPKPREDTFVSIGPYTLSNITMNNLLESAERFSLPPELFPQLEKYYQHLPLVPNENILLTTLNVLGESIWGGMDNFSVQNVRKQITLDLEPISHRPDSKEPEEAFLSMKVLEERYAKENLLIQAVTLGQTHKAEMIVDHFSSLLLEQRATDPIQNLKNYTIILNTLLRKAAESGGVHPLHIDSLSSRFAFRIEQIGTQAAGLALQKEMTHKYCLLVKNHSMKGYSLLVKKVLTRIDSDLTADLSLKTQARMLNVNSSYLSTLFKKETGSTLTEYVNRKRVEHAIFLLNSTNMQIQTIAQYCGIPDVNYFTKTFKKLMGKTPKEYRDSISSYR